MNNDYISTLGVSCIEIVRTMEWSPPSSDRAREKSAYVFMRLNLTSCNN